MKPTQAPFKRIVLTCAVLAVALILFTEESRGVISVSVSASPLWTDTGITLNTGSQVSITASGSWYFGDGQTVGPEGASFDRAPFDRFTSAAVHGELIGYIGPDPFQGHAGDGSFFPQATGYLVVGNGIPAAAAANFGLESTTMPFPGISEITLAV